MKRYRLTKDAEKDLREVARYTLKKWGPAMLREYRSGLKKVLEAIANDNAVNRSFSDSIPELLVTKYKHHFIFYITEDMGKSVVIGVIHERRNIVKRISERLKMDLNKT